MAKQPDPDTLLRDFEAMKTKLNTLEQSLMPAYRALQADVESVVQTFHTINERLENLEVELKTIRPDVAPLPQEIREGVTPAQVYMATIESALTAFIISNPAAMSLTQNKTAFASRTLAIDSALAMADAVVERLRDRVNNQNPPA